MTADTHQGNDPAGGLTVHRGLLENCPAPDCQDRVLEQDDESEPRIPLDQHTPETLAELYDRLEDAEHYGNEARDVGRGMYESWKAANNILGGVSRAVNAVANMMRVDSRDWAADRKDAYLWGVVIGWDDAALTEIAEKHRWDEHRVDYVRKMRELLAPITTPPPSQTHPEAR